MDRQNQFSFQFIFVMLLSLIIVILSVMIITLGKNIYDNINEDRNTNYELQVSLSYIANKIRQSDKNEAVEIKELNGINAVVINEVYDEEKYQTWIYFYDGAIYEMFTDADNAFELSDGMKVVKAELFEIEKLKDNLYKFTAASNGEISELYLSLYSKAVV
ncbi:MAG TPA: hypothetical protein DC024_08605 [Clostridiales bacterium]|nr:hypothetical protein [Clostridiales bacterium]HCS11221.1 hypothetical protein [Clostridiales bacterium]